MVVGSYLQYTRDGSSRFRGRIETIVRDESDTQLIHVTAYDKSKGLRQGGTVAGNSGQYQFSIETDTNELTDVALSDDCQTDGYDSDCPYPVYPAASEMTDSPDSDSPWIAKSASRTTTLAADISSDSSTTPIQVTNVNQFVFPAFIQINSEVIQVEHGYVDGSGDHWLGGSILRGALGSTPATHSSSDDCYQRVPKTISDANAIQVRRDPANTVVTASEYRVKQTDGRFDFANDPSGYTTLEADYTIYDEDDASAETVAGFIGNQLEQTVANLGPGLAGANYDVSGLDNMYFARLDFDSPVHTWDAITLAINECWTKQGGTTDMQIARYDAATDKFVFRSVTQDNDNPDYTIRGCTEVRDTAALTELYSAVLGTYYTDQPSSLLSTDRMWHPTVGDRSDHAGGGGNANQFNAIMYQYTERARGAGWLADTGTSSNNVHTEFLLDGDPSTGWGIRCADNMWDTSDPGTWVLFAWFPEAQTIEYVSALLDCRSWVPGIYAVEIVGLTTYTPGDPPSLGDVVGLGGRLYFSIANTNSQTNIAPRHMVRETRGGL